MVRKSTELDRANSNSKKKQNKRRYFKNKYLKDYWNIWERGGGIYIQSILK